jgi:small-conductance mechanosensitive channel
MLNDSMIIVPNSKLASSAITNFSLPSHQLAITIDIGVDYESDLERVERITLEVAQEVIAKSAGAAREFEPRLRYHTLGDSSVNFTVSLGACDYVSGMALKHEFIKCLHGRYQKEHVLLPFPVRTIEFTTGTLMKLHEIFGRSDSAEAGVRNGTRIKGDDLTTKRQQMPK